MASGANLQAKVAKVLAKVNATSRAVQFRATERTGGNATLGLGGTVTTTDSLVDPQPAVELISTKDVADSSGFLQLGDYRMLFAGTVAEATLKTSTIVYGDEVLKIVRYEPFAFDATVAAWQVIARAAN